VPDGLDPFVTGEPEAAAQQVTHASQGTVAPWPAVDLVHRDPAGATAGNELEHSRLLRVRVTDHADDLSAALDSTGKDAIEPEEPPRPGRSGERDPKGRRIEPGTHRPDSRSSKTWTAPSAPSRPAGRGR